jgi:predicted nucleic acid-binding protein
MPIRWVYHFMNEPLYGPACTALIKRVERQEIDAVVSTDVLADIAHRLTTLEAAAANGWKLTALASRLRKRPAAISALTAYKHAIASVRKIGFRVVPITHALVESATTIAGRYQLLMGDALITAVMQAQGLTSLASQDADFDRVPWIKRYSPV